MQMNRVVRLGARIILGLMFLVYGGDKIFGGRFTAKGSLSAWATGQIAGGHVFAFYRPFLERVVIPNDALFAWCVALCEFFLGVALLSGVLLRLTAFLGALLIVLIGLGSAAPAAGASLAMTVGGIGQFLPLILLLLVVAAEAEGDPLGGFGGGGSGRRRRGGDD
jgi:uncharacterized membrane protein YphA (DoxX/SURF4 family)